MPLPPSWVQIKPVVFGAAGATLTGIPAMPGIYRVVCLPMRRAYVGQTVDLAKRCLEHQVALRDGTHTNPRLLGAYRKLGPKAFCFQVLEVYTGRWSPDVLSPAEQRWMNLHGKGSLFNIRPAGSDAWLEATGRVISNARDRIGGRPSSSRKNAGSSTKVGDDNQPQPGDNRPLGRGNRVGTQDSKDWRNRLPGKRRRD